MDLSPLFISIKTAGLSMVFTFFLGLGAAWAVFCLQKNWLKAGLDMIFTLPMVLPPTVMGFFLLYFFGVKSVIGAFFLEYFGIRIAFSWGATVLAAVTISFPLMYRSCRGAFEQVDIQLIHAAKTLGVSSWNIFWHVVIPCAFPGVAAGSILSFARGLGEFGATAMIAGNMIGKTRTLPLAIYSHVAGGNMPEAYLYVAMVTFISFAGVGLLNYITYRQNKQSPGKGGKP